MAKSAKSAPGGVRRLLLVIVATAVTVAGLALLAGGGYMLIAAPAETTPPPSLGQVSAQEADTADPTATPTSSTDEISRRTAELAQLTGSDGPTSTPPSAASATPGLLAQQVATPTRVVRVTPTATPIPSTELPDTGFGGFLQPLAGFAFIGVALTARALRNRH